MQHDAQMVATALPAIMGQITAMDLHEPSTGKSLATVTRLTDAQLTAADAVANAPLPALSAIDKRTFAQCLRMMDVLPRRKDDDVGGELRLRAYELALGDQCKEAMEYLVTQALKTCRFFPSTSECVEIIKCWQRNDHAVQERRQARILAREERQARLEDTMARLATGDCDQAEIDALPDSVKQIGETRGYLRRDENEHYTSPIRARLELQKTA